MKKREKRPVNNEEKHNTLWAKECRGKSAWPLHGKPRGTP